MKSNRVQSFKGFVQQGFTLVELAIVLVIAGIILVGVLKGTDSINKAKVERAVADLKGMQATIMEYQKRVNRLPGDCNNDGIIALNLPVTNMFLGSAASTIMPDATNRDVKTVAVCGTPTSVANAYDDTPTGTVVPASGIALTDAGAPAALSNLVFNELRRAGVVDGNRTSLELAKHLESDVFLVGAMQDASTATMRANVIVMYGIPVWLAEGIDAEIDGVAQDYSTNGSTGPAATGRVRLWSGAMTGVTVGSTNTTLPYPTTPVTTGQYGADRDALVSISYQFDTIKLPN